MIRSLSWLGLASALLIAVSCTSPARQLQTDVEATALALHQGLVQVQTEQAQLVKTIEDVYAHLERYDLSPALLATPAGGAFTSFEAGKYYYKTVKTGASYYCSPLGPVTPAIGREVRIQQQFEAAAVATAERTSKLVHTVFYGVHEPIWVVQLIPWVDVVSVLPPGLKATQFEWYNRGLGLPAGQSAWSSAPFISLYAGWVVDLSAPVSVDGRVRGVSVMVLPLDKIQAAYLQPASIAYLLLGPGATLVGLNRAAAAIGGWKVIADVDYLKQIRENSFVPATYQLTDPGQSPGARALGAALAAGKTSFEVQLNGQGYWVQAAAIAEAGFTLVGLARQ